jgi:hypothetical protein
MSISERSIRELQRRFHQEFIFFVDPCRKSVMIIGFFIAGRQPLQLLIISLFNGTARLSWTIFSTCFKKISGLPVFIR